MAIYTDGVVPWNSLDDNTRLPLSSELEGGYPCGPADPELFNWTAGWPIGNIWNVILKSGITPDTDKLLDLTRAIRAQKFNFFIGAGTANALSITMEPTPADWADLIGVPLRIVPAVANTGAATLAVSGLAGTKQIVSMFGTSLVGGQLVGPVEMIYDGTKVWAKVIQPALDASRTYYVNASTGNDSNDGRTTGTAFATVQKAVDVVATINRNGFDLNISVADGSYGSIGTKQLSGPGNTKITGNLATPANVRVGSIVVSHDGWVFEGMRPSGSGGQHSLLVSGAATTIGTMSWALNSGGAHMAAGAGGTLFVTGVQRLDNGGATVGHMFAADGGSIRQASPAPSLVISAAAGFGNFVVATAGQVQMVYSSITGAANVTAGSKFAVSANGVINTQGAGVNYFPGPTAGTTGSGGQYV